MTVPSDVHLLTDSRLLGCEMPRAHLHVVCRDNTNGAWAKSRRQRVVPLDFLVVQVFDVYEFERFAVPRAGESDFLLVNLFREPVGAPMRPDAINELIAALPQRCRSPTYCAAGSRRICEIEDEGLPVRRVHPMNQRAPSVVGPTAPVVSTARAFSLEYVASVTMLYAIIFGAARCSR